MISNSESRGYGCALDSGGISFAATGLVFVWLGTQRLRTGLESFAPPGLRPTGYEPGTWYTNQTGHMVCVLYRCSSVFICGQKEVGRTG